MKYLYTVKLRNRYKFTDDDGSVRWRHGEDKVLNVVSTAGNLAAQLAMDYMGTTPNYEFFIEEITCGPRVDLA